MARMLNKVIDLSVVPAHSVIEADAKWDTIPINLNDKPHYLKDVRF
jgi:hypothetical protein